MKRIFLIFMVILGMMVNSLYAQQMEVTGTVTDTEGMSLPGVTVMVKGTAQGTITDANGRYSIQVERGATLVFSFIGMMTEERVVEDQAIIDVVMQMDVATLDEIVVVGYGTRLRSELTGSISSVRSEDIEGHTMPSFETALQGRTSGVHISGGSGKAGQYVRTRVRGSSSISASSQPLYVIDGVPVVSQNLGTTANEPTNPLADLNPADIESIEVLKDASAAAIYGSRAANGVIIITTRRGQTGAPRINVSTQLGFSEPANKVGFLNREQYLDLFREAYSNTAGGPNEPYWFASSWEDPLDVVLGPEWRDESIDVNWEDHALRNGAHTQFDINVSGGIEDTRYYAALSLFDQVAIVNGNEFDRISGRLNLDQDFSDRVSFGLNMNLARSRNFRVANDNAFATPLQMVALPPIQPDYIDGEPNRGTVYENGLLVRKYNNFDTEIFRNFGNIFLDIELFEGFKFRSEAGVDILNQREEEYRGRLTNDGGPTGFAFDRTVTSRIYNIENYFTYDQNFGNVFDLNLVFGSSLQMGDFNFASMTAVGFPSDDYRRVASASEITSSSSSATSFRYASFFARANMKFADNYLLTISGRQDGSSRFGRDNRWGFFPAASLGWIMSNEEFLQDVDFLSFLKPRLSWGVVGNSEIGDFASLGLYQATNYAGLSGIIPTSLPSDDLKWETTTQTNIGLDFGLFNNRVTGEIDYYVKNTEDLLLFVNLPATSGFNTVYRNVGKLENRGWEFSINTVNIDTDLYWSTNFNIAFNENKVTDLDDQIIQFSIWRVMEGQPIGVFYTKEYAGVDPQTGDALFYLNEEGDETTTSLAAAANRIVGDPNPDFWGGLTNTFRYRGFDLSFLVQFVYGNDIFNGGRQWQADGLSWFDNQTLEFYENRWQEPGDDAKYPQPRWDIGNGYGVSSMLIFDGSYIRLKEVTLGYTLPRNIVERINISNARLFVRAYNLLTLTDYPGWDPEANFLGTDYTNQTLNIRQGHDFYTAPQPRTITFGLNLNI